ncbi:MAG TPA: exodeoxyribonuclease VII large subunit [Luteolibacter sp.]|nr:exodeoxyribonuclease VII large subunit [Luteolibacter sp.]
MDLFSKPRPEPKALSVTQLLRRMKNVLEIEIGEIWVEGEISNLKKQASGHWYFSLKDDGAQIQCAMFGAKRKSGSEVMEDGVKIRAFAEATVYEARGTLQIVVQKVERAGAGDLQARFEALKRKLHEEGLFDADRKKPIPRFPRVVGIITSDTGAAIRDILNVLSRRAPWVQPVLIPVRVQGRGAELEIAAAIKRMGEPEKYGDPRCDVMIVGRGGGSLEDLWNFNEEVVARAIAACPIPVISAVGHEIDFTIADFVADLRAPTPSAAAELAVPDGEELVARFSQMRRRLARITTERLREAKAVLESLRRGALRKGGERLLREPAMQVDALRSRLQAAVARELESSARKLAEVRSAHRAIHPLRVLERRAESLVSLRSRLEGRGNEGLSRRAERLSTLKSLLRTLGPESAFQRGFSITLDDKGEVIRSAEALGAGQVIRTKFADGEVASRVEKNSKS